jgi:hypothetical protein
MRVRHFHVPPSDQGTIGAHLAATIGWRAAEREAQDKLAALPLSSPEQFYREVDRAVDEAIPLWAGLQSLPIDRVQGLRDNLFMRGPFYVWEP